jgi:hypothetical protein
MIESAREPVDDWQARIEALEAAIQRTRAAVARTNELITRTVVQLATSQRHMQEQREQLDRTA